MTKYRTAPRDINEYIRDLEKRIEILERSPQIGDTSIDSGFLRVRHPITGTELLRAGAVLYDGVDQGDVGVTITRPDGIVMARFLVSQDGSSFQEISLTDRFGNTFLRDDYDADAPGFVVPHLAHAYAPITQWTAPSEVTTSVDFVPLWTIFGFIQQAGIQVAIVVKNDSGSTSEVRLKDQVTSTVIDGPVSFGDGAFVSDTLIGNTPEANERYSQTFTYDVEMRRDSGAGNVKVSVVGAFGTGAI